MPLCKPATPSRALLETHPHQENLGRPVARCLGLDGLDHLEGLLEQIHQLVIAAAVEQLDHQRALGLHVVDRKIDGHLDEHRN
ncbi:hypothetical protein SDC9_159249 [bioreactor metagenome]|uniref:Uncharacterized protein n=1 Tax=bioreactor metagenome TaxID=1076179 RepID=A0A645FD99_9ZZZZ